MQLILPSPQQRKISSITFLNLAFKRIWTIIWIQTKKKKMQAYEKK